MARGKCETEILGNKGACGYGTDYDDKSKYLVMWFENHRDAETFFEQCSNAPFAYGPRGMGVAERRLSILNPSKGSERITVTQHGVYFVIGE